MNTETHSLDIPSMWLCGRTHVLRREFPHLNHKEILVKAINQWEEQESLPSVLSKWWDYCGDCCTSCGDKKARNVNFGDLWHDTLCDDCCVMVGRAMR